MANGPDIRGLDDDGNDQNAVGYTYNHKSVGFERGGDDFSHGQSRPSIIVD